MNSDPAWSHPIKVDDIPEEGEDITLSPDEETRAGLARFTGVLAVPAFTTRLRLLPDGTGGAVVTGTLDATVRQNCVVSLEPFDNPVHEEIALRFAPEAAKPAKAIAPDIEIEESDPSDSIIDGVIDLGAVMSEFLILGIDPYPKKPGAIFTPPASAKDDKRDNPFAALEKLKKKGSSSG
jgi:uncharacterized metal-binding protein YceD (DUF177 family)